MCFGSGPSAPSVQYVGPSEDDIRRNEEQLETYQQQLQQQQTQFQTQLQSQVEAASAETAELQASLAADTAAASAASAAQNATAYNTSATQTEIPEGAVTTETTKKKKKPDSSLRISRDATTQSAGTGLNIGV